MQLIILDRDGVINFDSEEYIKSPEEWHPIPGSLEAIARLNQAGYKVAIATNQSGIGRGYYDEAMLQRIHQKMLDALQAMGGHIDVICFCPHHPQDNCDCRKPKPGLLQQISSYLAIDLADALMIGDSRRDIEAALSVGARAMYIHPEGKQIIADVPAFNDLASAVSFILNNEYAY